MYWGWGKLTIRRQWLLVLAMIAVVAISVNSIVLSLLTNKFFLSYNEQVYSAHLEQIEKIAENALSQDDLSQAQIAVQLESHLDDPIIGIRLYDAGGSMIASADYDELRRYGMMNGMMSRMMQRGSEETDSIIITHEGTTLGTVHVIRYSALNDSAGSVMFQIALLKNSLISFIVVLAICIVIGVHISKKLGRDLGNAATQALSIDMGEDVTYTSSKIKEIRIIQASLETLQKRLKIKQVARKRVVDELVHQTRTPLTILRTHLEAMEDGITAMSEEEIKICQAQVDSISSTILNMSTLIDAEKSSAAVHAEEFDVHALLSQIIRGMNVQFEKKKIDLKLSGSAKVSVLADKNKLSQSIYNLLTNAYKFTEPSGKVDVSYEVLEDCLSIHIKDSGIGISKEDLLHVFDAYYQGHAGKTMSGDGLGLYVAKENLEQMGGTIRVLSDLGQGSEFVMTLPVKG